MLFVSGICTAYDAGAQNVRSVQTTTNPQPRQINNSTVIVIPKNETKNVNSNHFNTRQNENSNRTVRKVENSNQSQGNKRHVKRGR